MDKIRCRAIILAGGSGKRAGADMPKQFIEILTKPLLVYTLEAFENSGVVDRITLVLPQTDYARYRGEIENQYSFSKLDFIVPGGATRQESSYRGVIAGFCAGDILLVHDGARPFVSAELIEAVYLEACEKDAAIAAIPVKDTIKVVKDKEISSTLPRQTLWAAQTPQAFRSELLLNAHQQSADAGFLATDDASMLERLDIAVSIVEGSPANMKMTTKEDWAYAEFMLLTADKKA